MENKIYPPVGPPVIERVLLVAKYGRPSTHAFESSSLPGHLIQLMLTGKTRHEANGRQYDMKPGSLIWYHQDELVRGRVVEPPWTFYTLNFIAPSLTPPPFEDRVRQVGKAVLSRFTHLLLKWQDTGVEPAVREMRVQAALLELLAELWGTHGQTFAMDPSSHLWWQVETWLREDLARPMSLAVMASHFHKSVATIARSSEAAVGLPPMKRLKQIRMSLARGLVMRSDMLLKQVAAQVGYERVHEFSRDYRLAFGLSPRNHRQRGER